MVQEGGESNSADSGADGLGKMLIMTPSRDWLYEYLSEENADESITVRGTLLVVLWLCLKMIVARISLVFGC